ncbi:MAG: hypothetical protein HY290_29805, partial [Planctomycetia bacterium]|nr:hypothetical protein [Planctomycetia bacterium]
MTTLAAEPRNSIALLCRRFAQVSGWDLQFTPVTHSPAEIRAELEQQGNCRWITEITDGSRPAGFLHIDQPEAVPPPHNLSEATQLAESLARLLGRLA